MNLLKERSRRNALVGQDGKALFLLIVINVLAYILLTGLSIMYILNNSTEEVFKAKVLSWMIVPAQPAVFATKPWTLITHMFVHFGFLDLFSKMAWLFFFGFILKELTGNRIIGPIYLYGGFVGALVFLLTANLVPALQQNVNSIYPLTGSAAATMAIAAATTTLAPHYRVFPFIKLPLWAISAAFAIISFASMGIQQPAQMAGLAAGAAIGFLVVWQMRRGNDWCLWMHQLLEWFDNLFNPDKVNNTQPLRERLHYKSAGAPFKKTPHITQQRIDELLDKIAVQGYNSLTQEEKDFLKKASREDF